MKADNYTCNWPIYPHMSSLIGILGNSKFSSRTNSRVTKPNLHVSLYKEQLYKEPTGRRAKIYGSCTT